MKPTNKSKPGGLRAATVVPKKAFRMPMKKSGSGY